MSKSPSIVLSEEQWNAMKEAEKFAALEDKNLFFHSYERLSPDKLWSAIGQRKVSHFHIMAILVGFLESIGVVKKRFELGLFVLNKQHPEHDLCESCIYNDNLEECCLRKYCMYTGQHRTIALGLFLDKLGPKSKEPREYQYVVLKNTTPDFVLRWLLEKENNVEMSKAQSTLMQTMRYFPE